MSKQIRVTFDDATAAEIEKIAVYRFGDSTAAMSEYVKLATIQLLRREAAMLSKAPRTRKTTSDL
jgi:hypothetical protein